MKPSSPFASSARASVRILAFLTLLHHSLPAADLYVSPGGNDSNGGGAGSPFATIERARDAVRAQIAGGMTENITVHLGAGNYFIEQPVVLDDRDGGRDGFTITYQGSPNLATRIYGGRRITNWTKVSETQYTATVADLQQHYTLYENDQAANGGLFHVFNGRTAGNWSKSGTTLTYYPRNLPIADQVVVLGTVKDVFIVKGRSNTQIVSGIVFDGLHMIGSDFTTSWPGGVTGFDAWSGTYDGVTMTNKPLGVIFPEARHGQFFVENARGITIRNSKLYGAGFMAAFFHRWAQENVVENCWIEEAGCSGLFFQGWECGRGASEGITTLAASYCNKFNVVRNNVFHDIGRFQHDGGGVYLCWSGDNLVEHNIFNGITRYGVSAKGWRPHMINNLFHWVYNQVPGGQDGQLFAYDQSHITYYDGYIVTQANQGEAVNHSRNNLIRYNDFSQIARTGDDMGMIEQWGTGYNNVWEYNACHDGVNTAPGWDNYWMNCLYDDDGAHYATIRGNIVYWIAGGGMSGAITSKGNYQNNVHNIVADCELAWAVALGPYVEEAHNMTWSKNIAASQLGQIFNGGYGSETVGGVTYPYMQTMGDNVYFYQPLDRSDPSTPGSTVMQSSVAGNQGLDKNSIYADPRFDRQNPWWNSNYTDYRLKSDSPALAKGFQQADTSLIGLRPGFPFDAGKILGQYANQLRLAADYSRLLKLRILDDKLQSRHGTPLPAGSWARYDDFDFDNVQARQFRVRMQQASNPSSTGTAIEIRLDAPDGTLIGTLPFGQTTCRVSPTTGRHNIFLVFPNANLQTVEWFVFEPNVSWTGGGANDLWSTAANWSGTVSSDAALTFGASARTTPSNDLAGAAFPGISFEAGAPAYTLGGNALRLTGDIINSSASHQTIQMPLALSSLGEMRIDTGASGITLGGPVTGSAATLVKTGGGNLTISGSVGFGGDITMEEGTLSLAQPTLADTATVRIESAGGAVLDLAHGVTDRVNKLFVDGVRMEDGTYGSSASAAIYKNDSAFTGTGVLFVQEGPCPPVLETRGDGATVATFAVAGSGTWTVPPGVAEVEVLVVGGGGAGSALSGGGGAGGMYYSTSHAVTPGTPMSITVGAGGAPGSGTGNGENGGASQFGSQLIAYGGIRGNNGNSGTDTTGGNQGGYSLNGGATVISGRAISNRPSTGWISGSGAGAAGALGTTAAGGIGVSCPITGTSRFYAGGGGSPDNGAGGSGIGGNGATANARPDATAGAPHTGSGGGGGRNAASMNGGGSGIIILAYTPASVTPTTTLLASSANPSTNGQTVVFTASVQANGVTATDAAGNCIFKLNGEIVATAPITNGSASFSTSTLDPGPHLIEASYLGDVHYDASSASITQTNNSSYTAATPVITTRADGRKVATFSNSSLAYWAVPAGVTSVEVLVVGGGGGGAAGGTWCADGGGAGGLHSTVSYPVTPGRLLRVLAGPGGARKTSYGTGNTGQDSVFDRVIAYGGQGGGWSASQSENHYGGNQGGHSVDNGGTITPGFAGGGPSSNNGGGGAGQPGATAGYSDFSAGGNGLEVAITGTSTYYAGGGGGGYGGGAAGNVGGLGGGGNGGGGAGVAGLGGGGGGGSTGGAGGSGIVILSYQQAATWTVTFDSNGGSIVQSQAVVSGDTATAPPDPTKAGHVFKGWFADSAFTTTFNFSSAITADITLYAKWTANHTLTYLAGAGGSVSGTTVQVIEHGGGGSEVTAVANSGYRFAKWSDDSLANPRTDTNVTADLTVTALFEPGLGPITPTSVSLRDDGKTVATFTSGSGLWTIPAGVETVEVLVVGGGGGGAAGSTWNADGGGGGGLTYQTSYPVTGGSAVALAVGTGGAARSSYGPGNNGNASTFGSLTAAGGEGGLETRGGNSGGLNLNGTITTGGLGATHAGSNGGGGAGQNGSGAHGASPGGNGYQIDITGTPTYYAGGGGGGYSGGNNAGGLGGGGKGANENPQPEPWAVGHAGTDGLGGGGGASRDNPNSGAGGSGVVIVAYLAPSGAPYDSWKTRTFANAFTDTDPTHDPDGDGLTNYQEFAFGLDPSNGSSGNPVIVPPDPVTRKFRYTRWAASGLAYSVEISTDLQLWNDPADVTQTIVATVNGVETIEVGFQPPQESANVFVRVKAD